MNAILRNAGVAAAVLTLIAAPAVAKVPSPGNCTVPTQILLVGSATGVPDPAGTYTVIVRNLANNPSQFDDVWIDLSNCPDVRIASNPLDPATTVDCATRTVHRVTDVLGSATFRVLGCATRASGSPGATGPCAWVWCEGVRIGQVSVACLDQDGQNGVGANDLSLWLGDFGIGGFFARSDYDGSGALGANDLSLWISLFGAGGSSQSATPICP